jgi:hypothetical protein
MLTTLPVQEPTSARPTLLPNLRDRLFKPKSPQTPR